MSDLCQYKCRSWSFRIFFDQQPLIELYVSKFRQGPYPHPKFAYSGEPAGRCLITQADYYLKTLETPFFLFVLKTAGFVERRVNMMFTNFLKICGIGLVAALAVTKGKDPFNSVSGLSQIETRISKIEYKIFRCFEQTGITS